MKPQVLAVDFGSEGLDGIRNNLSMKLAQLAREEAEANGEDVLSDTEEMTEEDLAIQLVAEAEANDVTMEGRALYPKLDVATLDPNRPRKNHADNVAREFRRLKDLPSLTEDDVKRFDAALQECKEPSIFEHPNIGFRLALSPKSSWWGPVEITNETEHDVVLYWNKTVGTVEERKPIQYYLKPEYSEGTEEGSEEDECIQKGCQ